MRKRTQILLALSAVTLLALPLALRSNGAAVKSARTRIPEDHGAPMPVTEETAGAVARLRTTPYVTPPTPQELATWFQELPRAEDLPADVHFSPPGIARAGERFGTIVQAVQANPSYREEAAQFFGRCTEDETVLDGIRALCLHNWREYRASVDATEPHADERIKRIAGFLPKQPRQ